MIVFHIMHFLDIKFSVHANIKLILLVHVDELFSAHSVRKIQLMTRTLEGNLPRRLNDSTSRYKCPFIK